MPATAYIGLGSNQGDRELHLLRAVAEIGKIPGVLIRALSSFYETEPVGDVLQEDFLNAVMKLETEIPPKVLLEDLLRIETDIFRRKREQRWGPRTMDLDLLSYDSLVTEEEGLILPHPELHRRLFCLIPLAEIAPGYRHPVLGLTVEEMIRLAEGEQRVTKLEG